MMINGFNTIFVILSGGYSTRMGKDKAFVGKSKPFIQTILRRLHFVDHKKLFVSIRWEQFHRYKEILPGLNYIIDHNLTGEGPMRGILTTFNYFRKMKIDFQHIVFLSVDIPYVRLKTINRLLQNRNTGIGSFFIHDNIIQPFWGLYSRELLESWNHDYSEGRLNGFSIIKNLYPIQHRLNIIELPPKEMPFFKNFNSPEDLTY